MSLLVANVEISRIVSDVSIGGVGTGSLLDKGLPDNDITVGEGSPGKIVVGPDNDPGVGGIESPGNGTVVGTGSPDKGIGLGTRSLGTVVGKGTLDKGTPLGGELSDAMPPVWEGSCSVVRVSGGSM